MLPSITAPKRKIDPPASYCLHKAQARCFLHRKIGPGKGHQIFCTSQSSRLRRRASFLLLLLLCGRAAGHVAALGERARLQHSPQAGGTPVSGPFALLVTRLSPEVKAKQACLALLTVFLNPQPLPWVTSGKKGREILKCSSSF